MKSIVLTVTLFAVSTLTAFAEEAIVKKETFEMNGQAYVLAEMNRTAFEFIKKTTRNITVSEGLDLASKVMKDENLKGLTPVVIPVGKLEYWVFNKGGDDWTFITNPKAAEDLNRFYVILKSLQ